MDAELTAHGIVLIRRLVIVCDDRVDGAERHFIFFKIGDGVMLDRVRELVAEKAERLTPRGGEVILRVAVCSCSRKKSEICVLVSGKSTLSSMFKMVSLYMVNGSAMEFLISIIFALPEIASCELSVDGV